MSQIEEKLFPEQILELLVLEQFLDVLPSHIQNWVQKYHPQNVKEAVALVDRFHRECGGISNEVTTHQLGNDTVLLGGTAVAPGFKWKPAEPQPMGVFQGESSNIYQVLQEPRWNTHKESQPVDEGGLKLTNDTGNDPPVSLPTLEIQPSGCEVLGKATMKDAEITVGNENHGDTCRVRKRPRSPEAPALASHFVPGDKLH